VIESGDAPGTSIAPTFVPPSNVLSGSSRDGATRAMRAFDDVVVGSNVEEF
jgi:hypothetical protein